MSSSQEQVSPTRVFICPRCEQPALGYVRGIAVQVITAEEDEAIIVEPPSEYALLQCDKCHGVSMQLREDYGEGFDGDDDPWIVFPEQRRLSWEIPGPLRLEFDEARKCFGAKAYKATVVIVRRVLEGACQENNVQERTLVRSLEKMKANGLIDATIAEWADALRVLGNEGAHYTGKQVPRADAEDALAFAEALLDHIYVLRKRFEEFANRRAAQNPIK